MRNSRIAGPNSNEKSATRSRNSTRNIAIGADYNQILADLVWKYFADEIAEAVNRNAAGFRARTERMQKGR